MGYHEVDVDDFLLLKTRVTNLHGFCCSYYTLDTDEQVTKTKTTSATLGPQPFFIKGIKKALL